MFHLNTKDRAKEIFPLDSRGLSLWITFHHAVTIPAPLSVQHPPNKTIRMPLFRTLERKFQGMRRELFTLF